MISEVAREIEGIDAARRFGLRDAHRANLRIFARVSVFARDHKFSQGRLQGGRRPAVGKNDFHHQYS
jgi:hypothetical protein